MSGTLRLRGATSGYSELQAPAVAADQTFVLPTAGGTLLTTDSPVPKLTLELGSASQPSLTFEGDTDTGLYSSGTNTLNLVTGGSNRLNITSGGAVGINTTSPSALLDVNGALRIRSTSIFDSTFQVGGDAQGGSAGTQIFDGGNITVRNAFGSNDVFRAQVTGSATYNIALTAGGDAHFLGDVGIGTSSPSKNIEIRTDANDEGILLKSTGSTSNALDLDANRSGAGNAIASIRGKWNGTTVAQIGFLAGADTTNKDDGVITFGTESAASNGNANATERMRIDSSGKVGIGTTSPGDFDDGADQLVISKAGACGLTIDSTSGTNSSIHFADGSTGNESYRGFIVYENGNDALKFGTSAEEAVRIDSSGRLLVGASTSPTSDVDIKMVIKSTGGPSIQFQRDDATTTSDNLLGRIVGTATDGSATPAAQIALRADGTHTASSSPGRIVFDTTADGDTATTERMRIDSSGRLLVGTTSPGSLGGGGIVAGDNGATGGGVALTVRYTDGHNPNIFGSMYSSANTLIGYGVRSSSSASNTFLSTVSNTSWPRGALQVGDELIYSNAAGQSTTVGSIVTMTERLRIDNSGNVGIGNTDPGALLHVADSSDHGAIRVGGNNAGATGLTLSYSNAAATVTTIMQNYRSSNSNALLDIDTGIFTVSTGTSGNEHMRILSSGHAKFTSANGSYYNLAHTNNSFDQTTQGYDTLVLHANNASPYGMFMKLSAGSEKNNAVNYFLWGNDESVARVKIFSNGGIHNFSGNNVNLCDEREKKNIVSLDTKWDKVKSWELRKFHYNDDEDTDDLRYGVIAQQVEAVCPEVLDVWVKQRAEDARLDKDGNVIEAAKEEIVRKGVKEQQMMWMAIKALQEAQARIETLEAKFAAFEAN